MIYRSANFGYFVDSRNLPVLSQPLEDTLLKTSDKHFSSAKTQWLGILYLFNVKFTCKAENRSEAQVFGLVRCNDLLACAQHGRGLMG